MMHRPLTFAASVATFVVAAAGACTSKVETNGAGGSGNTTTTTTTGAGGAATPDSFCQGKIDRTVTCTGSSSETLAACVASADTACLFEATRPEIIDALVTCLIERPCSQGDDTCFYQVGADTPTSGQAAYATACTDKHTACVTGFATDYCGATILTSARYADLTTCFALPCAEVGACLDSKMPASCQ